uniref:HNH domain-containing protein n=1 Tax=Chlorobium chlorochromatii (strain CaD3) TaxID=340177 RepID=Q3AQ71_CHLCH
MRPIRRGTSPIAGDYQDYDKAKPELISRLGSYCSYCERRIATQLSVEHIQPKALPKYAHFEGRWTNFLLSCVNCNSTKYTKDFLFTDVLLPDRDNTFAAFTYLSDGTVQPSILASEKGLQAVAQKTLELTGLHKEAINTPDINGKQVALDRVSQRQEVWAIAERQKSLIRTNPNNLGFRECVIDNALANGFFSVWMTVFEDDTDILSRLIAAFPSTKNSGCFTENGLPLSPALNPDNLEHGGKL